mmetsp:Transcript_30404/g.100989  ORF Transcript_30404/g.100989 Transcript_30404/m.100989 type:complete len:218 (-) Transcript_30404:53-706(-)
MPPIGAQALQQSSPQPRQWCRRRYTVNSLAQRMHVFEASLGTQAAASEAPPPPPLAASACSAPPALRMASSTIGVSSAMRLAIGPSWAAPPKLARELIQVMFPSRRILRRISRAGPECLSVSSRRSVSTPSILTVVSARAEACWPRTVSAVARPPSTEISRPACGPTKTSNDFEAAQRASGRTAASSRASRAPCKAATTSAHTSAPAAGTGAGAGAR